MAEIRLKPPTFKLKVQCTNHQTARPPQICVILVKYTSTGISCTNPILLLTDNHWDGEDMEQNMNQNSTVYSVHHSLCNNWHLQDTWHLVMIQLIIWLARWSKPCALIAYPSEEDGVTLHLVHWNNNFY